MKLIDADKLVALFERLEGDTITVTDAAAIADNAPVIKCERCVHYDLGLERRGVHSAFCLFCCCASNYEEMSE